MALFENNVLTNGTQVTVPRYLQEDSTLVNIQEFVEDAGAEDLYTIPTGKILYITDITFQCLRADGGFSDAGELLEYGGVTQRTLLTQSFYNVAVGSVFIYKFSSPIYIEGGNTLRWYAESVGGDYSAQICITGWLEDA